MVFYPSNSWGERVVFMEATERSMDITHAHGSRFLHLNFQLGCHREALIDACGARQLVFVLNHFIQNECLPHREAAALEPLAYI